MTCYNLSTFHQSSKTEFKKDVFSSRNRIWVYECWCSAQYQLTWYSIWMTVWTSRDKALYRCRQTKSIIFLYFPIFSTVHNCGTSSTYRFTVSVIDSINFAFGSCQIKSEEKHVLCMTPSLIDEYHWLPLNTKTLNF